MQTPSPLDRRQGIRLEVKTSARLLRHGHLRPCRLLDLSPTGARLGSEHMDLPVVHPLELPVAGGGTLRVSARVVWRHGVECGVKFCGSDVERLEIAELVDDYMRHGAALA
ncbi:MAG: PilZ domain-containing protein [Myxococcales bacterium]|nr:PilZ domain-containing protein [Myxococcales bacterium]